MLGISRWLEGTLVPQVPADTVTHQRLLRTMDTLDDCADAMQSSLAGLLRPLVDEELSIVFYDLTTISVEGTTTLEDDLRRHGMSKDGLIRRQVMLGVVQTADGLPIHHEVYEGNAAETRTLVPTIERVLQHFPIKRVVLVADRGLLSLDNLEEISKIKVGVRPLEFILAVPARRYGDLDTLLDAFHTETCQSATHEVMSEFVVPDHSITH
jgi:transposase